MTKPQSLREELQDYAVLYMEALEDDDYEEATKQTNRILKRIEHRLPEKKHAPTPDGAEGVKSRERVLGYNQAISEVQSILKGE